MVSYYSPLVPLTISIRTQCHIVGVALLAVVDSRYKAPLVIGSVVMK